MAKKLTPAKLDEAGAKHRKIKLMILELLEKVTKPDTTKERIGNELFKIYEEVK